MGCLKITYKPTLQVLRTHEGTPSREAKVVQMFTSVDPLAEKYPSWNPYAYTFQNPINFIDPTGMEGEDPPNSPPKKNIVINLLEGQTAQTKSGVTAPLGKFDEKNMAKNGWHVINASTLDQANTELTNYLKDNKADNIFINSHGRTHQTKEGDIVTSSLFYNGNEITGADMANYAEGKTSNMSQGTLTEISALVSIANKINPGKNLVAGTCESGMDDRFGINLSKLAPDIDIFMSKDFSSQYSYPTQPNNRGLITRYSEFSKPIISNSNYKYGFGLYRGGERVTRSRFNLQMNNTNGVRMK